MSAPRGAAAVVAATALNLPFGTLYAFSVFLGPMERLLGVGRAEMSIVFALATIALTVGMNIGPRLYRVLSPALLAICCGTVSASGLLLAAGADRFAEFVAGYGVLFGLGAGVGFIVVHQGVNQAVSRSSGLANGYVVSLYPLGAMIGAPLFGWGIDAYGIRATFAALAAAVFIGCALAAALLRFAGIAMHDASAPLASAVSRWPVFFRLATVFFLAAAAGLMVMSQAAGIVQAYGGQAVIAIGATTMITGAVGGARIAGGWLIDRFSIAHVAIGSQLVSLCGALLLSLWPGPLIAVPALAMIGMGYGAISGLTAAAIARYWGRNAFGRVASRLYVAWCVAAVSLPVLAGLLYDRTGGYGAAVLVAAGANLAAVLAAVRLPSGSLHTR